MANETTKIYIVMARFPDFAMIPLGFYRREEDAQSHMRRVCSEPPSDDPRDRLASPADIVGFSSVWVESRELH